MSTTPEPTTVGAAFVQALAPDQYAAYADRIADREAAVVAACDIADARTAAMPPAPTPEPTAPEVGQRYTSRPGLDPRTVTVTRVWDTDTGPAVAYEWRDNQPGQCGSALPLGVFLGTYKPVVAPEPTVTPAPVLSDADDAALASLRKLAGGEQA